MRIAARGGLSLTAVLIVGSVLALGGCREEEQDRILLFEQGTYLGVPDNSLDDEQVGELRSRALRQQY